jgi:hypothetical protein
MKSTFKIEPFHNGRSWSYINQYNDFWAWKIRIEQQDNQHILDSTHIYETSQRLVKILARWQTYRGVKCDFYNRLPSALMMIADAYNSIRRYTLLDFHDLSDEPLRIIWDALGQVKEKQGVVLTDPEYFIISICKPLMFIWGQTLAFDSINRQKIMLDESLRIEGGILRRNRWKYSAWKSIMNNISREMKKNRKLINYFKKYSLNEFGSNSIIPYGRILDIYYYYQMT